MVFNHAIPARKMKFGEKAQAQRAAEIWDEWNRAYSDARLPKRAEPRYRAAFCMFLRGIEPVWHGPINARAWLDSVVAATR